MELTRLRGYEKYSATKRRVHILCIGALTLIGSTICLAKALTEEQSIQIGLNQPDFVKLLDSHTERARGSLVRENSWPNPEVELGREELDESSETNLWVRQRLDISGRRGYLQSAAQANIEAAIARNDAKRIDRSHSIRRYFFKTLYFQQQQTLLTNWVDKFTGVEGAMIKREQAGDVSGYDRRRISREKVSLLALQRQAMTSFQVMLQKLLGLTGADDQSYTEVEGKLRPDELPPLNLVMQTLSKQPSFVNLQNRIEASRLSAEAVSRSKVKDVTLGLGMKQVETPGGDESGFMLSASLPIPFFNRRQGEQIKAQATLLAAQSEYQLAFKMAQAEVRGLWQQSTQLLENARLFKNQSVGASAELVRIAETSYQNNEIGVLELIDAYHSALSAEKEALKLELDARLVRLELDKFAVRVAK